MRACKVNRYYLSDQHGRKDALLLNLFCVQLMEKIEIIIFSIEMCDNNVLVPWFSVYLRQPVDFVDECI